MEEIPDSIERRSYKETCAWSVLCKEDKDQLNRIEELLKRLLEKPQSEERD